jgi:hypothetical protein
MRAASVGGWGMAASGYLGFVRRTRESPIETIGVHAERLGWIIAPLVAEVRRPANVEHDG